MDSPSPPPPPPPRPHQEGTSTPDAGSSAVRIFVGDLSYFCTEEDLRQLFLPYGDVRGVEIRRSEETQGSLMHGFVEMEPSNGAAAAAAELNNRKFMGRKIRVVVGGNNSRQGSKAHRVGWVQIQVSFVSRRMDVNVNEELLDDVFAGFGEVMDVTIKKHQIDSERKNQSGYGFVFYASFEESMKAVHSMKKVTLNGITFDCNLTHRSEQQLKKHLDHSPSAVSNNNRLTPPPFPTSSSPPPQSTQPRPRSAPRPTQHAASPIVPSPPAQANYSVSQQPTYPPFISASPSVAYQHGYGPNHPYQSMREMPFIPHHAPYPSHHFVDPNLAMNYPNYHPQPLIHHAMSPNNRMDAFHVYGNPIEYHAVPFNSPPLQPIPGSYPTHVSPSMSTLPPPMLADVNAHHSAQQGTSSMGRNTHSPRLPTGHAWTPPSSSTPAVYSAPVSPHPVSTTRRHAPSGTARTTLQRAVVAASLSSSHSASTSPLFEHQPQQLSPTSQAVSPQSVQHVPSADSNCDEKPL